MIDTVIQAPTSGIRALAQNVWKATIAGRDYAIKAEKKTFVHNLPPTNRNSFRNRWNDLAWAIEVFVAAMADSGLPVWARALTPAEGHYLYNLLPQASTYWNADEWGQTPLQIVDYVHNLRDFGKAAEDGAQGQQARQTLSQILEHKEPLRDLGRGVAVDVWLGNEDRIAADHNGYYVNFDNFFYNNGDRRRTVFYTDFWDPNSANNSCATFSPSDTYLGGMLRSSRTRRELVAVLLTEMQRKLGITVSDPGQIEKGMQIGMQALAKYMAKTSSPPIARRLSYCGIK